MIVKHGGDLYEARTAIFSDCMTHRYTLKIIWNRSLPLLVVIGLNPSTADEMKNDPTIGKLCKFAKAWSYGGLLMLNLFAFRSPDPKAMMSAADPIGAHNQFDDLILHIQANSFPAARALAAWGSGGTFMGRGEGLKLRCQNKAIELSCLRKNPDGTPTHPLARGKNHVPLTSVLMSYNF